MTTLHGLLYMIQWGAAGDLDYEFQWQVRKTWQQALHTMVATHTSIAATHTSIVATHTSIVAKEVM